MTKLNMSPSAIAKRKTLAAALKTNLAKRKALAKQQAAEEIRAVDKAENQTKSLDRD